MFARTGNYLDDADHIYGRACKIYKKVKGKDRIPISDEFYYQCYKYLLSRSQGSSLVPDFDAYRRASQITDSIDIFPMKISSVSFLMNISLVNNDLISAREWARKALILADDAAKNEKEGTFNIAEIEGRLSYIYYRLMADGETAALRDINDLIERYRTRNAPPGVMLYIFNYVLNFNSDPINKDIKPLCIEYLSSIPACKESIYTYAFLFFNDFSKGRVEPSKDYLKKAWEIASCIDNNNDMKTYLSRLEAENMQDIGKFDLAAQKFVEAIQYHKNSPVINADLLLYLYHRLITCYFEIPEKKHLIAGVINQAKPMFSKSKYEKSLYEIFIKACEINVIMPENKRFDEFKKLYNISKKFGLNEGVATCAMNLGFINNNKNRPDEAAKYFEEAFLIYSQIGDIGILNVASLLCEHYNVFGNHKRRREILHFLGDEFKKCHLMPSIAALNLFATQMDIEVGMNNSVDARYYYSIIKEMKNKLFDGCNNDFVSVAIILSATSKFEADYWHREQQISINKAQRDFADNSLKDVLDLTEIFLPLYKERIGINEGYFNFAMAKCRALAWTSSEFTILQDFVNSLREDLEKLENKNFKDAINKEIVFLSTVDGNYENFIQFTTVH